MCCALTHSASLWYEFRYSFDVDSKWLHKDIPVKCKGIAAYITKMNENVSAILHQH